MYYTYVLFSTKDREFYVGYTFDLKKRFDEHCSGRVNSTKKRRTLVLIYYESCLCKEDTIHRERYIKTHHGKAFIRNRIKTYLTG